MIQRLECSPMAKVTGVQSQVESNQKLKKWYLIPPCVTQHYKVWIKGKVQQSREGVTPFPTLRCSRYWRGSLRDSGPPRLWLPTLLTYLLLYIYIYIHICLCVCVWVCVCTLQGSFTSRNLSVNLRFLSFGFLFL